MATLLHRKKGEQFFDSDGDPLNGGKLYFYEATTTTAQATYSNSAGTTPNTNPVVLDSAGRLEVAIYFGDSDSFSDYKETLTTSTGVTVDPWPFDDIPAAEPAATAAAFAPPLFPWTQVTNAASPVALTSADAGKAYEADTTSGNIEFDLPSAASVGDGKGFVFKKTVTANFMVIDPSGSETIDNSSDSLVIAGLNTIVGIFSNGAEWYRVDGSPEAFRPPQGYLTLVSGTPVHTSDQSAKTAVFYTPDMGNLIPIYNGSNFVPVEFSELTLTLVASHAASTIYDIFVWFEAGVLTIGTGPAWSNSGAGAGSRGSGAGTTQLTRVKGLFVNAVSMTARNGSTTYTVAANRATYVGSIFIDGSAGQVTCHRSFGQSRKWGLWNAYNRRPIILKAGDSTASWTYDTATFRASNNASANSLTVFTGLAEELFDLSFTQNTDPPANLSFRAKVGIGVDSTTTASGFAGITAAIETGGDVGFAPLHALHVLTPILGRSVITSLEQKVSGTPDAEFLGGNEDMQLTARWMG
jgi:hypothetical protein